MLIGKPHRVEVIFAIPDRFLNQIYGVGVTDPPPARPLWSSDHLCRELVEGPVALVP